MKSLFHYLDYRAFLSDFYSERKAVDPSFSFQKYSDLLGFKAKDFIYRVMKGDKNLSSQSIAQIGKGLRFKKAEAEYFRNLVQFCQAKNQNEKKEAYDRILEVLSHTNRVDLPQLLEHQQLELFSNWYFLVVRSLIEMHGFNGDYQALAETVVPAIKPRQAKRAVEVLIRLGLVQRNEDGSFSALQKSLTTGEDVLKHALIPFYREMIELGKKSLESVSRNERHISGLTIGVSSSTYEKITSKIQCFRREVQELVDEDVEADRVYELALLLFPLSSGRKREENENN